MRTLLNRLNSLYAYGAGSHQGDDVEIDDAPPVSGFMAKTVVPVAATLGLVSIATVVLLAARSILPLVNLVSVVYLAPVLIAATRWGLLPAVAAAFAGAAAADYLFYPPLYSFVIGDTQNIADLVIFLIIAFVTSHYMTRLRRRSESLVRSRRELRSLYAFSCQLAACFTVPDLVAATGNYLSETLGHRTILVGPDDEAPSAAPVPDHVWREALATAAAGAGATRTIHDSDTGQDWLVRAVSIGSADRAAIVDLGPDSHEDLDVVIRRVDAAISEAAVTLGRLDVAKAIEEAHLKSQADSLRDALIGTVTHELRTPLASIIGSTSVLDQIPSVRKSHRVHGLVEAVREQASRLDGDIQNLLNAARITGHGIRPHLEWTDPTDIVSAAVRQKAERLTGHRLEHAISPDLPLVKVSSVLVEQAFGQLLENAAKYSPAGSTIRIAAHVDQDRVVLSVSDEGAGLTTEEKQQLGNRSFRGTRHINRVPGAGLGLWIADTFTVANGGTLDAHSAGPGLGTTMSIRLPAAEGDEDLMEAMA
jgi:two-component system, OmpR family, sensor histidine kinase KdpD